MKLLFLAAVLLAGTYVRTCVCVCVCACVCVSFEKSWAHDSLHNIM